MRRMTFVMCGLAAGLAALTACGTAATTGTAAAQPQVRTVAQLAQLVSTTTSTVHSVHLSVNATSSIGDVTGQGDVDFEGGSTKIAMSMTIPSFGAMKVDLLGGTLYIQLPAGLVPSSKPWIKFDSTGSNPISKALSAVVSEEQQYTDPSKMIGQYADSGTITKISQSSVDGQPATEYMITVNTQKLLNSSLITPQLKQLLSQSGADLPPTINTDVWVNSQNLPVKSVSNETISGQHVTATVLYTDWGQPVRITAPPADQVGTLPSN